MGSSESVTILPLPPTSLVPRPINPRLPLLATYPRLLLAASPLLRLVVLPTTPTGVMAEIKVMVETKTPLPRLPPRLHPQPSPQTTRSTIPLSESLLPTIPNHPHLMALESNPPGDVKGNTSTNTASPHLPSPSRWIFLFTIYIFGVAELL